MSSPNIVKLTHWFTEIINTTACGGLGTAVGIIVETLLRQQTEVSTFGDSPEQMIGALMGTLLYNRGKIVRLLKGKN